MINKNSKIYLAGHTGLVGSSVLRVLKKKGFKKIILKKRKELDLTNQAKVFNFLKKTKPDAIIICAAKVGGISANNKFKSEFSKSELNENIVVLLKPITFMNNSGIALKEIKEFYDININNIYVIHDEIDLDQGRVKVKNGGGHNGHNGLKSIDKYIGKNYNRIRVGVSRPSKIYEEKVKDNVSNWVLSDFTSDEKKQWLDKTIFSVSKMVVSLINNQTEFSEKNE